MNGKGSKRRPCLIPRKDYEANWDLAFGQKSTAHFVTGDAKKEIQKMFEIAQNLPKPHVDTAFCSDDMIRKIRAISSTARDHVPQVAGIHIEVVEDPTTRRALAFQLSATTGRPVLCEIEEGRLATVWSPNIGVDGV
jgi:hypothetical protein